MYILVYQQENIGHLCCFGIYQLPSEHYVLRHRNVNTGFIY